MLDLGQNKHITVKMIKKLIHEKNNYEFNA